ALTAVLQHHVVTENAILFTDFTDGAISPVTLEGDALQFSILGNQVIITDGAGNSDSSIIPQLGNIQAVNGIVHGVDRVLLPKTGEGNDDGAWQ
ncbi:MAG: fasciclin domain-containing protein, partial [Pricia sp.]